MTAGEGNDVRVIDMDIVSDRVPEVGMIDKNAGAVLPKDAVSRQLAIGGRNRERKEEF